MRRRRHRGRRAAGGAGDDDTTVVSVLISCHKVAVHYMTWSSMWTQPALHKLLLPFFPTHSQ